jgi:hypothetical protein
MYFRLSKFRYAVKKEVVSFKLCKLCPYETITATEHYASFMYCV